MALAGALLGVVVLFSGQFYSVSAAGPNVCKTFGSGVFQTFNGTLFHVKSTCPFTLTRFTFAGVDCSITVQREPTGLMNRVVILVNKVTTILQNGVVSVEGNRITLPFDHTYQHVYQYGIYIMLKSKVLPFSVTWLSSSGGISSISVQLNQGLVEGMTGMCGRINSTENVWQLVSTNGISDGKCVTEDYKQNPTVVDCEVMSYAKECRLSKFDTYMQLCLQNMFPKVNINAKCAFIKEIVYLCGNKTHLWSLWRKITLCQEPSCPGDLTYQELGPAFPPTCSNPQPNSDALINTCLPPAGMVVNDRADDFRSVRVTDCPCVHGGKTYAPGQSIISKCQSCVCKEGKWVCSPNACPPRCIIEGQVVTTFDGKQYSLPGKCTYVAAKGLSWTVTIKFSHTDMSIEEMNLDVYNERYTFAPDGVKLGDISIADLSQTEHATVFWQSSMFVQVRTSFGMKMQVQVSPEIQLYLYMPPTERTKGLCGTYNNNTEDDFTTSSGIIENSARPFASSWTVGVCSLDDLPICMNTNNEIFAEDKCAQLTNTSGVFASCHDYVPVNTIAKACVQRICQCTSGLQKCLCVALGNYAKACASQGIDVGDWRAASSCSMTCRGNLRFSYTTQACNRTCRSLSGPDPACEAPGDPVEGCSCLQGSHLNAPDKCSPRALCLCHYPGGTVPPGAHVIDGRKCTCEDGNLQCSKACDCPHGKVCVHCTQAPVLTTQKTCKSLSQPLSHEENCTSGCYCPEGQYEDHNGSCVTKDKCTCEFSGAVYSSGQSVESNCRSCVCVGGKWDCKGEPCPGVCEVFGNGQYSTFDSKWYRFDGHCQYTLVEDASGLYQFAVRVESVPCCDEALTCSRSISVELQKEVTLTLRDMNVTQKMQAGWHLRTQPLYSVHTVGLHIIITVPELGLTVVWDKQTRVKVQLQARWKGRVRGLCGNFDGKVMNDLLTSSSSVVFGTLEFGNSWKAAVPPCSDATQEVFPCQRHSYCSAWAQRRCMIMHSDTFKDCHLKVDPAPYYEACVLESCSCEFEGKFLGFCTAVAAYAEACSTQNVCINWRTPDLCPVYCDYYNEEGQYSWHYEPCGQIKTCGKNNAFTGKLEGCYPRCPPEMPFYDENTRQCSSLDRCTCYFNSTVIGPGDSITTPNECCKCTGGNIVCGLCSATRLFIPEPTTKVPRTEKSTETPVYINTTNETTQTTTTSTTPQILTRTTKYITLLTTSTPVKITKLTPENRGTREFTIKYTTPPTTRIPLTTTTSTIQFSTPLTTTTPMIITSTTPHITITTEYTSTTSTPHFTNTTEEPITTVTTTIPVTTSISTPHITSTTEEPITTVTTTIPVTTSTSTPHITSTTEEPTTPVTTTIPLTTSTTTPHITSTTEESTTSVTTTIPLTTSTTSTPHITNTTEEPTTTVTTTIPVTTSTSTPHITNTTEEPTTPVTTTIPLTTSTMTPHITNTTEESTTSVTTTIPLTTSTSTPHITSTTEEPITTVITTIPLTTSTTSTPHITNTTEEPTTTVTTTIPVTTSTTSTPHITSTTEEPTTPVTTTIPLTTSTSTPHITSTTEEPITTVTTTIPVTTSTSTPHITSTTEEPTTPVTTTIPLTTSTTTPHITSTTEESTTSVTTTIPLTTSTTSTPHITNTTEEPTTTVTTTIPVTTSTSTPHITNTTEEPTTPVTTTIPLTTSTMTPHITNTTEESTTSVTTTIPLTTSTSTPHITSTTEEPITTVITTIPLTTSTTSTPHITNTTEEPTTTVTTTIPVTTSTTSTPHITSTTEEPTTPVTTTIPLTTSTSTPHITSTTEEPITTVITTIPLTTSTSTPHITNTTEEPTTTVTTTIPVTTSTTSTPHITSTTEEPTTPVTTTIPLTTSTSTPHITSTTEEPTTPVTTTIPLTTSTTTPHITSTTEASVPVFESTTTGFCMNLMRNQTWPSGTEWTEDCFRKACRNGVIEMRPVTCPPQIIPQCPRDLMLQVKDEQGCCDIWQCNCQCDVYGDPHYVSFSGTSFDFMDNCTYVLVEEIKPRHHLSIVVDNYYCNSELFGSCAKGIILKYLGSVVTLQVNDNEYTVEATLNDRVVQPPHEENGIRFESGDYQVSVYIDEIRSRVSLTPANTLEIILAMEHFYENTQGQCGICGGASCVRRSGQIESDDCCDKTAYHWIEEDPAKLYCAHAPRNVPCSPVSPSTMPSLPPTTPSCVAPLCDLLRHELFHECAKNIDMEVLVQNCRFDYCLARSKSSMCSPLEHLAEQCKKMGFCVYWRNLTNGICNVTCPEGMNFDECHRTTNDVCHGGVRVPGKVMDNFHSGCFCPDNQLLADKHKKICVSECTNCRGPLGEPMPVGATWESNCHVCTCNNQTQTEECWPKPPAPTPTCSENSTLVLDCCNNQICVEKTCEYNGRTFKVGDVWTDQLEPCITLHCTSAGTEIERRVCPQQSCSEGLRVWDEDQCCYTCNITCSVQESRMTVMVENCKQEVTLPICEGFCQSHSMWVRSGEVLQLQQDPQCCQESSYEIRKLSLSCGGAMPTSYSYKHITGCECKSAS